MKAVGLLSGGLDSTLAVKLILEQGTKVHIFYFDIPFAFNRKNAIKRVKNLAEYFKVPIKIEKDDKSYLRIVKKPKYGYGKHINPCIDCKIFMYKKAKKYAKSIGAKFIFTGEVLSQRPMSQYKKILLLMEKEAGLKGKVLRPLSAKLLPETIPEKRGQINRKKLLFIKGRRREKQLALAKKYKIKGYSSPGGGCLLTYKEYANKIKDLFKNNKRINENDITLLRIGRHFRYKKNKIIVGRNEKENKELIKLKGKSLVFEVPDIGSPITILQGKPTKQAIKITASLTARYSDSKQKIVLVKYGKTKLNKSIQVKKISEKEIKKLRV